ncbi:MAG: cellulose synthase subunit BcsC-related outer membrane protein [Pseudomonas sp.]
MFRYRPLTLALLATLAHGSVQAEAEDPRSLLIQQGHFWQAQEKPKRASEVWNKLLLLDAGQPDALYGLGLIEVQDGKLAQAGAYLQRLQALQPVPRQALQLEQDIRLADPANQALLDEARLLVEGNERGKAVGVYRRALGGKPGQGQVGLEVYNNLGYVDGHWAEARSGMERLLRESPNDSYIALFLAKHLARHEDSREEGIRALAKLAQREDIGGDADESWRLTLTWMGPPRKAQQPLFEQFLRSHPDDEEIRALLAKGRSQPASSGGASVWRRDPVLDRGLKALDKGDLAVAERDLTDYLKSHPNNADALGGLGILRQRQERFEDAEVLLTKAVKQGGGRSWQGALDDVRYWSLLQRARDNLARDRSSDARQQLEQARRLKPKDAEALLTLAELQAQQGELAAAEAGFRQALAQRSQETRALRGLAQVMGEQGKPDEALKLLESLPKAERDKLGGLGQLRAEQALQRAKAAEKRGDSQGMRRELEAALRDDPNNAWARFALARLYVDLGAVDEARSLMDGLLKAQPHDRDALYTSALLSIQLQEWSRAQTTLAQIPRQARNADINRLVAEVDFNLQLQRINELSSSGRKAEARAFLGRIEPLAEGKPARLSTLASAYADAGDPQRAIAIMRDLLARSPRTDLSLTLSYGRVLLEAGQDVEVAGILGDLQGRSMTTEQRKQYDDLLFYYRVRQAEQLRQRGELAAAYETLAPALAQRPQDRLAVSALARMYGANGDTGKALELFKPLVKRHPDDANLLVGAADMAAQEAENSYAEDALEQALKRAPNDVDILTTAARVYRYLGRTGKAAELLGKVVAQEKLDQTPSFAASTAPAAAPRNPFAGIGSTSVTAAAIPVPVQNLPVAPARQPAERAVPSALAGSPLLAAAEPSYATGPSYAPAPTYAAAPQPASRAPQPAANPFVVAAEDEEPVDPRAGMSEAERALDDILQQRSPYLVQGVTGRSNDSESGLSKLTDIEAPFEASMPLGDNRLAVRVTPVSLNAGSLDENARDRFGGGPAASLASPGVSPGSQKDSGVGLALAFESPATGVKADLGTTPQGFLYSTAVGGVSLERAVAGSPDLHWSAKVSRRAVTDSLLSFAGAEDKRTGQQWGGVTANGGRAQLAYDNREMGAYAYGGWHRLMGNHVEDNDRAELGTGVYWYLQNDENSQSTIGLNLLGVSYEENQGYFTYGHGGYFSPQTFFALGVPVTWAKRYERLSFQLKGSVGVQSISQDDADYFPGDDELQAAASKAMGSEAVYEGDSSIGVGYNLSGAAEYRLGSNFFVGGQVGVDNAQDYRQWNGGLYLRYMFEDQTGPLALPVSPYQSPYAN